MCILAGGFRRCVRGVDAVRTGSVVAEGRNTVLKTDDCL